ncbi:hypothetical protein [Aeromonas jandaei]|uniref:hypothetical protein n=1 Tax=Aeromonas jandaei TaxID=650 RepID=UPI001C05337F|nr:hypothetical protein [Aeromonas jandaei]QWL66630.1 hypothetical protein HQ398_10850 [Aeromonas jandaei]
MIYIITNLGTIWVDPVATASEALPSGLAAGRERTLLKILESIKIKQKSQL